MKIFSVDVGIKNLSFCLFEVNENITIVKWDNIGTFLADLKEWKKNNALMH